MAERPVFIPCEKAPFYRSLSYEFTWNGGFAVSQSRKNIAALHAGYLHAHPGKRVLEISSKSELKEGNLLSAFRLEKYVPTLGKSIPVELIYQASKVFTHGGPYTDLLEAAPKDAKRDERLKNSGELIGFRFEGVDYTNKPSTAFYNYMWMNALLEHPELAEIVLEYDAFTDIIFNPNKGLNCQASAAAAFVAITKLGKIDEIRDYDSFLKLLSGKGLALDKPVPEDNEDKKKKKEEEDKKKEEEDKKKKKENEAPELAAGMTVVHKVFGTGVIQSVNNGVMTASFPGVGDKILGVAWCLQNCQILP